MRSFIDFYRKKARTWFLMTITLLTLLAILSSCSKIPLEPAPYVVYIKADGLYYALLDGTETKIREGSNFIYPLVSKSGSYIAYTQNKHLFIYDVKNQESREISDQMEHYYSSYDWLDDDRLVYGSFEEPGIRVLNSITNETMEIQDDYYYVAVKAKDESKAYASRFNKWQTSEGKFVSNEGIVEMDFSNKSKEAAGLNMNLIIKGRKSTEEAIGYSPLVWNTSEGSKYIFIMEKPASGSLSADGIGVGVYDLEQKMHWELKDVIALAYANNLVINSKDSSQIGLVRGEDREMINNKEVVILEVLENQSYTGTEFLDKNLLAMTPSFSSDGKKLFYSATEQILNQHDAIENPYEQWKKQPHHIYEYDLEARKTTQITSGEVFDFMPASIGEELLFIRSKGENRYDLLIKSKNSERILAKDLIFSGGDNNSPFEFYGHTDTEKGMSIYQGKA